MEGYIHKNGQWCSIVLRWGSETTKRNCLTAQYARCPSRLRAKATIFVLGRFLIKPTGHRTYQAGSPLLFIFPKPQHITRDQCGLFWKSICLAEHCGLLYGAKKPHNQKVREWLAWLPKTPDTKRKEWSVDVKWYVDTEVAIHIIYLRALSKWAPSEDSKKVLDPSDQCVTLLS